MTVRVPRPGVALLAALALLSLVALLIAGSFASFTLSQRSVRGARADELLVASADYALNTVLASPAAYGLADLPYGERATLAVSVPGAEPVAVAVSATRLAGGTIWLVADAAFARGDSAHRRINLVAQFQSVGVQPGAPIESRGNVRVARGVSFLADDAGDPDCARSASSVVLGPGATLASGDSIASGTDSAAADSGTYGLRAAQVAELDSAGVVHVRGDTAFGAGTFDGVLLVDGALEITGSWTARGLVVVRGPVRAASGSIALTGALMAFGAVSDSPTIDIGAGTITWSPCTVQRALRRLLGVRPVPRRSWAELF